MRCSTPVRELLRAEETRATSLHTRGSGLAGFVGVIVSVSAAVGRDALSADLSDGLGLLAVALFATALAALLAAVLCVVLRVLLPQSHETLAMSDVRRYPLPDFVFQDKVMVQGRTMRGLIEELGSQRGLNDARARGLQHSYTLLLVGLGLGSGQAIILGLAAVDVL